MALPKPGKKRGPVVGSTRKSLNKVLAPFKDQFKAASRKPKGKMPAWFADLSPQLQAQVRQEAFKTDMAAMPTPEEIGAAVLDFWSK